MVLQHSDYYTDYRWCPSCRAYVHYLSALEKSYCVQCGKKVRCFRSRRALDEVPFEPDATPGRPDPVLPRSA